jgi:hypothetical protein
MKTKIMAGLLLGASFLSAAPRVSFGIGIGVGVPGPRYYAPAPVYVAPAPVYAAPAPVYAPAYVPPAPGPGYVWTAGYWYGYGPNRVWRPGYWAAPRAGFYYRGRR